MKDSKSLERFMKKATEFDSYIK